MEILTHLDRPTGEKSGSGMKGREAGGIDAYLQSIVNGTRRMKPGRGRTTTATWKVPTTASSFLVGLSDSWEMSNWMFGVCRT